MLGRLGGSPATLVALVRDPTSAPPHQLRALKLLDREMLVEGPGDASFAEAARRAGRLRHPNIVALRGFGSSASVHHLVMEYVFGASLAQLLRASSWARTPLTVGVLMRIFTAVLEAVEHAQDAPDEGGEPLRMAHGFLTPHNILVGFDGVVKVADFGIARITNEAARRVPGNEPLVYAYMAPEQIAGAPPSARSDVYSIGVCLWEALTGKWLFAGESAQAVQRAVSSAQVRRPSEVTPALSPLVDELVMRALARSPEARWASAREMREAIEALIRRSGVTFGAAEIAAELGEIFHAPRVDVSFALQSAATSTLSPCDLLRQVDVTRHQGKRVVVLPETRSAQDLLPRELFPEPLDLHSERARPWSAMPVMPEAPPPAPAPSDPAPLERAPRPRRRLGWAALGLVTLLAALVWAALG